MNNTQNAIFHKIELANASLLEAQDMLMLYHPLSLDIQRAMNELDWINRNVRYANETYNVQITDD